MALSMSGTALGSHGETTIIGRLGVRHGAELIHRHGRAMIMHANAIEQRGIRTPGAQASLNPCGNRHGLFHARLGRRPSRPWLMQSSSYPHPQKQASRPYAGVTVDLTRSPSTTRLIFRCVFMLNTRWACRCPCTGNRRRSPCTFKSLVQDVAIGDSAERISRAPTCSDRRRKSQSHARRFQNHIRLDFAWRASAAAVSVEKYGFPVPAAKNHDADLSRGAAGSARIKGSATCFIRWRSSTRV